jgi:hypothetical protein
MSKDDDQRDVLLPKRSEICSMRSGRQVPSVSMTATRPSAPPFSLGSCAITAMVCESCVLPQPSPLSAKSSMVDRGEILTELPIDFADAARLKAFIED